MQMYLHCNKDSTQRLGYSPSANILALQQGQYTAIGILIQCKRTGTATRPVYNDWDTHPMQMYLHCNKDSIQRLGYSSSANVFALQQGQYTTIGILIQCKRTCTATRPVHSDWDTHPVRTYWHCNKASTQRLGYSPSANVLALQQGQYTTIGTLTQCERTGTATRPVYNDWDTHPVRTYLHCNKASIQRLGYSPSANVLALQQGQYTTIGILTQCERTGTATRPVYTTIGCMVAAMLLQGAGMPPIFSHLFVQYDLYGCLLQQIPVASQDLQTILDRVKNDDIRVDQFDDEVVTLMASADMTCQLTQRNSAEVARPLALQASPVTM